MMRRDDSTRWLLGFAGCVASMLLAGAAAGGEPWLPRVIEIPAGPWIAGSDDAEREAAYQLDQAAYGSPITRQNGWYARERPRHPAVTGAYGITATPITNGQYAVFVTATEHAVPDVDRKTWDSYGLIHPYERTRRYAWTRGRAPSGREGHPVVLVDRSDANAYAQWLSLRTGQRWRLPTEEEWEKAARGTDGRRFPWGEQYDAHRLNSADAGPLDTMPVGSFPQGASPFGLLDAAGQVYEWTATMDGTERAIVKGGAWDDRGCGICRPAARSSRPLGIKHILIGFRLVRENPPDVDGSAPR